MAEPEEMDSLVLPEPGRFEVQRQARPLPGPGEVRVRVEAAGICGSDLHYFRHGGFGSVRMRGPMVLGHEIMGHIDLMGPGTEKSGVTPGQAVAVDPSEPCGDCEYCAGGVPRFCRDLRFMGSAMREPPVAGGFSQYVLCSTRRAIPLGDGAPAHFGALSEPLAVALHAVAQLGDAVDGRRLLITGFGPIGALCLLAARHRGARHTAVADIAAAPLALARELGADEVIDLKTSAPQRRVFDGALECSGHPAGIRTALSALAKRGTLIQVGLMGEDPQFPLNDVTLGEIRVVGAFRFDVEFAEAARLISQGRIDVAPLVTDRFDYRDAEAAFRRAEDRAHSIKVLLSFGQR